MSLGIEEDNKKTDEHILVCLSAAPSNKKIIDTAAKMANALQARFTALYVRTGTKSEDLDKRKTGRTYSVCRKSGSRNRNDSWGKHTGTDRRVCQTIKCY